MNPLKIYHRICNTMTFLPFLSKKVCLTFDDGHKYPDQILEKLEKYGERATFFLCGEYIEANLDIYRKIFDAGHEIGNHSYNHPDMTQLSETEVRSQLMQTQQLIEKITGNSNTQKLFRFPYGKSDPSVVQIVKESGFIPVSWTIDSRDWTGISAREICRNVQSHRKIRNGAIILMYTSGAHTSEALDLIIPMLRKRKCEMVTVSELWSDVEI